METLLASERTLHRRAENSAGYQRALVSQQDALYGRLDAIEKLLKDVRGWFSPYTDNKWCVFCAAEVGEEHGPACPYPKWIEQVTYLLGPK